MSKHWKDEWQKETVVISGTPDLASLERAVEAGLALGYPRLDPDTFNPCARADGLFRMAVVGPDYTVFVPAVERVRVAELQRHIGRLTFYFVCTRPGIRALIDEWKLSSTSATVVFERLNDDGSRDRLEREVPRPAGVAGLEAVDGGRMIAWIDEAGNQIEQDAALLAQTMFAPRPFAPSAFDLDVRYIGRARGELRQKCALDRLESHEHYQAVLEEVQRHPRNRDVWLVLASGTTIDMLTGHEKKSGISAAELSRGDDRARRLLKENDRIDLVEALLINYFKPEHNTQHVNKLDLTGAAISKCRRAELTGISLAFASDDLGVAMTTAHVPPKLHHTMTVCL